MTALYQDPAPTRAVQRGAASTRRTSRVGQAAAASHARAAAVDTVLAADTEQAAANRVMNALLGGALNFAVDRALADELTATVPGLRQTVRRARAFRRLALHTAVRRGCTQLLDLGTGLPAGGEPAWPGTAVHVDTDPIVLADLRHAARPTTSVLAADLLAPQAMLDLIDDGGLLRLREPVTVLCTMVLHHLDDDNAHTLLSALAQRLAASSRVIVSALTSDTLTSAQHDGVTYLYTAVPRLHLRTAEQTAAVLAAAGLGARRASGRSGLFTATVRLPGSGDTDPCAPLSATTAGSAR